VNQGEPGFYPFLPTRLDGWPGGLGRAWDRTKGAAGSALDALSAGWEALKDQWRKPAVDTPFRQLVKDWQNERQWTGLETSRWTRAIDGQVRSRLRQEAMSIWLEADGDENTLRAQLAEVPDRYEKVWQTALGLTSEERALARKVQADFRQKLDDGLNLGLMEKGRADYGVPQLWQTPPKSDREYDPANPNRAPRNPRARLDPRDPFFALERRVPSYFDGIMAGGVPKDLRLGRLVARYNIDFHDALADRGLIKSLKDAKASDGTPAVMVSGRANVEPRGEAPGRAFFVDSDWRPKDAVTAEGLPYQTVNHWALRGWQFASRDADGNPILVKGDFLVHPEIAERLRNMLSKSDLRDRESGAGRWTAPVLEGAATLKSTKFALATFHALTEAIHSATHGLAGAPSAERLKLLWPSTSGVELRPENNPALARLMRNGMEMGFSGQRATFEEGLASNGGLFAHVPGLGEAMGRMTDWVFGDYIPKLKAKTGEVVLKANESRYGKELTPDQIAEKTPDEMNAAFGGQNWRLLGTRPEYLDVSRLLLTAPDFLLSRAKVVAQALKPYHAEQRYFLLAQAAMVYTAARVLNYVINGDPKWDASLADSVVWNGRAYKARFLVSDVAYALQDARGFAAGRFGVGLRAAFETLSGRDLRTGARIEVPIKTSNSALQAAQVLVKSLASWAVPVGLEGLMPGAAGREQTKAGQAALALAGIGSSRYTSETQMYDAARSFNQASTDPKVRLQAERSENEVHQASPYRKLDDLLEAGDLKGAGRELQALLDEGRDAAAVLRRYQGVNRPFTGSRAQEAAFVESLSAAQRKTYDQAQAEREQRLEQLLKLPQYREEYYGR
jgi:hypothetical protein